MLKFLAEKQNIFAICYGLSPKIQYLPLGSVHLYKKAEQYKHNGESL